MNNLTMHSTLRMGFCQEEAADPSQPLTVRSFQYHKSSFLTHKISVGESQQNEAGKEPFSLLGHFS